MKVLDIEEEIINKRCGVHYIALDQEEILNERLKELSKEGIFKKYDMTYIIFKEENHISLGINKCLGYLL